MRARSTLDWSQSNNIFCQYFAIDRIIYIKLVLQQYDIPEADPEHFAADRNLEIW